MSSVLVKTISGKGQIIKSGEFLCNVTFSYKKTGNPEELPVKIVGELLVEKSKRRSPEILNGLPGVPVVFLTEYGDRMDILVSKILVSHLFGRYRFTPMEGRNFSIK